jgi:hypothetical protein
MEKFLSGEYFLSFFFGILIVGKHLFEFLCMGVVLSIYFSKLLLIGRCVCLIIPGLKVDFFEV